jgi:hypothetical protein
MAAWSSKIAENIERNGLMKLQPSKSIQHVFQEIQIWPQKLED